jgi:S1-C subfamily serine protease
MACVEITTPQLGERLWATGYRQTERSECATLSMFNTSGCVTGVHLEGRGSRLLGPCIEVAMETYGGMSGGPVFNEDGRLIGIVSSGIASDDARGPTFVSLIWPALVAEVDAGWPSQLWEKGVASLKQAQATRLARVRGDVRWERERGVLTAYREESD